MERVSDFAPDVTLALALIHHMSLSGNVPFEKSAEFFATFSNYLVIEFPDRGDSWVQQLLRSKADFEDYFDFYNTSNFEASFLDYFDLIEKKEIQDSKRTMYLLKIKSS